MRTSSLQTTCSYNSRIINSSTVHSRKIVNIRLLFFWQANTPCHSLSLHRQTITMLKNDINRQSLLEQKDEISSLSDYEDVFHPKRFIPLSYAVFLAKVGRLVAMPSTSRILPISDKFCEAKAFSFGTRHKTKSKFIPNSLAKATL